MSNSSLTHYPLLNKVSLGQIDRKITEILLPLTISSPKGPISTSRLEIACFQLYLASPRRTQQDLG